MLLTSRHRTTTMLLRLLAEPLNWCPLTMVLLGKVPLMKIHCAGKGLRRQVGVVALMELMMVVRAVSDDSRRTMAYRRWLVGGECLFVSASDKALDIVRGDGQKCCSSTSLLGAG